MTISHPIFRQQAHWLLRNDPLGPDTASNIAIDTELLRSCSAGNAIARLWENPRSLVVTRRETRLPGFAAACSQLAAEGWPVVVRDSGGTAVPHEPGVLHLSLIYALASGERYDLDRAYQALCEPIQQALASLGVASHFGNVPDAYCDGRYNLIVNARKLTGTAQRLVPLGNGQTGILSQAMINVRSDIEAGNAVVNRFYQLAGDPRHYRSEASTSLERELPTAVAEPTLLLRQRLLQALRQLTRSEG